MKGLKVLIDEQKLEKRITELAKEIKEYYHEEEVLFCIVLKGAVFFSVDLLKKYEGNTLLEFIKVSSYEGEYSTGKIKLDTPLKEENIKGKNILIIEDIVDTGRTLKYVIEYINQMEPKSIKTCTLLDKLSRRVVSLEVDYIGFSIDDHFVIGYGLDYDEKYRHIPYIGYLEK